MKTDRFPPAGSRPCRNKTLLPAFLSAVIPVLLGTAVYLFLRPDTMISGFVRKSGIPLPACRVKSSGFVRFLRNHFPDIAWAYALPNALFLSFGTDTEKLRQITVISGMMILLSEGSQALGILPGTGDPADVIWELCALSAASYVIKKKFQRSTL